VCKPTPTHKSAASSSGDTPAAAALLRAVAPPILAALSFGARCTEYQLAGCMLLTQVCAQRTLEPAVAQSMLQALMRAVDAEVAAPAALAKPLLCVVCCGGAPL
jgi:hypothetical protein